jgi:hypothetical protein
MAIDKELEQELTDQIELLKSLQAEVGNAIGRATDKLKDVQAGKPRDYVFPQTAGHHQTY